MMQLWEARLMRQVVRLKRQTRKLVGLGLVLAGALIVALVWWLQRHPAAVFTSRGQIAQQERSLLYVALLLSLVVVIPVFALTIGIVLKYRETNHKLRRSPKAYQPEWDGSRLLESIWWGVPGIIIVVLSVITWNSSHSLDPYRTLVSVKKPLHIQVVSLDWKWLFIYPDRRVATVNYLPLPVNTPVSFDLTSGSVMNSLWIPQLGSQIYTMPGMSTQLHLLATDTGSYNGSSANISGKGFADMHFKTQVMSDSDFQTWAQQAQQTGQQLDDVQYSLLLRQAVSKPTIYRDVSSSLYDDIMMPFMMPMSASKPAMLRQPVENQPQNPDGSLMQGMSSMRGMSP